MNYCGSRIRLAERTVAAGNTTAPFGVVSKCAPFGKKEKRPGCPERSKMFHRNAQYKKSSSFVKSISAAAGQTFSKIAPS